MPERIEGRNAVREALKAGRALEKLYVQKGVSDAVIREITAGAAEQGIRPFLTEKEKLDALSQTGRHQGVIAEIAAYEYAEVSDILKAAAEKGEDPFILLLDGIEDPHNLGAILRSAHLAGAHGVIIPKNRAAGLNATVAKVSAGAVNYIPVARVTNLSRTMEELKQKGLWFVCADMDGEVMYRQNLTGPIGLVIGSEGDGVSALVRKHCDFITRIPMSGQIDSLNASVAAGILAFEVVRQRKYRK
jgi:23S rRNA (guanosine2251-2'-O)-methyltransferase